MRAEVLKYYGLTQPLDQAGYYLSSAHEELLHDMHEAILAGKLIALSGMVGSGKTVTLYQLQDMLEAKKDVVVAWSFALNKSAVKIETLISALYHTLSPEKVVQVPSQMERKERVLIDLFRKKKSAVVLIVDEAHDLGVKTLRELKRLMELTQRSKCTLSIVLAGHPKLANDLRRPVMEEISLRMKQFDLGNIRNIQNEYLDWLIASCSDGQVTTSSLFEPEARDLLVSRTSTFLQLQMYLSIIMAFGYAADAKPIHTELIESVVSKRINDLEPILARHGYSLTDLTERFGASMKELRAMFNNSLDATRTTEIRTKMKTAGLPV